MLYALRAVLVALVPVLLAVPAAFAQTTAGTGTTIVVPVTAQTASFISEITVYNPNGAPITVDVAFYEANNSSTPGLRACADVVVPANRSVQFALATQCTLTAQPHFGLLVLTDLAGTNPFYGYTRVQNPQGIGFSIEGFPAGNFNDQANHVTGLRKQAAAPTFQTNCFVGSLAQPVNYTLKLFDDTSGAQIGSTVSGSLAAFQQIRYLDIFGPAGVNAPSVDQMNVRAEFASNPPTLLVGFCTVQDNTSFGADFRIAKSFGGPGTLTSLAQGTGIALTPNPITTTGTIAVDTATIQSRVTGTCAAGSSIRAIALNGTVTCEVDDVGGTGTMTSLSQSTGITLSPNPITTAGSIAVNTATIQARVTGTCAVGNYIRAIAADGTVTCGADNGGPANAFLQNGNAFGADAVLGTTDNRALEIKVNNQRALRIVPSATSPNLVGGNAANFADNLYAGQTIAGGGRNTVDCIDPVTGFPTRACRNEASNDFATVGGGLANVVSGSGSTIGGGVNNTAAGNYSSTAGGYNGRASGAYSTLTGGNGNVASGQESAIGGGSLNVASGTGSTIGGGSRNTASGAYSWAGGFRAKTQTSGGSPTVHTGAFVWADNSNANDFNSTTDNEFAVRAAGGVRLVTATAVGGSPLRSARLNPNAEFEFGSQSRQMLNLWGPATYGIGIQSTTMYFRVDANVGNNSAGGWSWYKGGAHNDGANNAGGGAELMRLASNGDLAIAGTLNGASDVYAKRAFAAVDPQQILARVAAMPITTWEYRADDAGTRHIGPTAQDFAAAFNVGTDDKHIAMVDADGVALAAIQGLNAKLEAQLAVERVARKLQAQQIATQDAELAQLRERIADVETLRGDLAAMRQALADLQRERALLATSLK